MFAACSDEPPADKVKGSYSCNVIAYSRYLKSERYQTPSGQYRDTTYYRDTTFTYGNGNAVIEKIDDNTVSVRITNNRLNIDETYDVVHLSDFNYQSNLSSTKDSITIKYNRYQADFSGTVTYDPKAIALSLRVKNYPGSYSKYILTFNNR